MGENWLSHSTQNKGLWLPVSPVPSPRASASWIGLLGSADGHSDRTGALVRMAGVER